jgi:hypothetical protein
MTLPSHIVDRITTILATMDTEGFHVDHEAARYGGIALMGTIGATWLLRPDGTFWEVDDDFGRGLAPALTGGSLLPKPPMVNSNVPGVRGWVGSATRRRVG